MNAIRFNRYGGPEVLEFCASDCKKVLKKGGIYLSVRKSPKYMDGVVSELAAMLEKGIVSPIIDQRYHWTDIIHAHEYVDQGHKVGHVAIQIQSD